MNFGTLVGTRIREIRESRGISQRFVQKKLKKYDSWLCGIENGTVQLYAKDIPGLADALGVNIADIFTPEIITKCDICEDQKGA